MICHPTKTSSNVDHQNLYKRWCHTYIYICTKLYVNAIRGVFFHAESFAYPMFTLLLSGSFLCI